MSNELINEDTRIASLKKWGVSTKDAQKLLEALDGKSKILIVGPEKSGKTEFLNTLISLSYLQLWMDETEAAENFKKEFIKVKDGDSSIDYIKHCLSTHDSIVATFTTSDISNISDFFNVYQNEIAPLTDVMITMEKNKVWNIQVFTIHDRLVFKASDIFKNSFKNQLSDYDYFYIRSQWLEQLTPAEKAAVQLAHMNRSIENGGLGGWYQGEGEIPQMDIPDLLSLAKLGIEQNIHGYEFLNQWLISVRDEYLPAMSEYSFPYYEEGPPESKFNEVPLMESYLAWTDRFEQFDALLNYLVSEK
ncbi:hypothetical protein [Paenibacillus polymyxa]|uniref:hypothetical protein n=1 Tax=Paenibacillus polymyxa TaxID=1406 RepID=UPI0025B6C98A|nr:hypothetical protein [Paenibacillus polymyxa]MDN4106390.1 hypothetical protein [Paenibacillus polymyxa]